MMPRRLIATLAVELDDAGEYHARASVVDGGMVHAGPARTFDCLLGVIARQLAEHRSQSTPPRAGKR